MERTESVKKIIDECIKGQESTERVVEIPFLFDELPEISNNNIIRVLDVGACESPLVVRLNELGFDTCGIDIRECGCTHGDKNRNRFVVGDARKMDMFKDSCFDIVFSISTIEHIGLLDTPYAHEKSGIEDKDGDFETVNEMLRVLKVGGKIIITIPYGHGVERLSKWIRFYDKVRLEKLLEVLKTGGVEIDIEGKEGNGKILCREHCLDTKGRHVWVDSNLDNAEGRWSVWSDFTGAFIAANVCIGGKKL